MYVYECLDGSMIVALDPELLGYLLYCTIKNLYENEKGSTPMSVLSNYNLCMLWGIPPNTLPSQDMEVSSQQLLEFLASIDICSPLHSGVTLFPIAAPTQLHVELNLNLVTRRVYLFTYLPSQLFNHFASRVTLSLCPGSAVYPVVHRLDLPTGDDLQLPNGPSLQMWANTLLLKYCDGSVVMITVSKGKEIGPDALPSYGRVDVKMTAPSLQEEARLLKLVTDVLDNVSCARSLSTLCIVLSLLVFSAVPSSSLYCFHSFLR